MPGTKKERKIKKMNRIILRRLQKLNVNKKREILIRCSKEIGFNILDIKKLTDEEVQQVFDKILLYYEESDKNV